MKEQAISKINKMGKVGRILTIIARIFVSIAVVAGIIGTIFLIKLPDNFIKLNINGDATVDVDLSSVGINLSNKEQKDVKKNLEEGNFTVSVGQGYQSNLDINEANVTDKGFSLRANGDMANFSLHNIFAVTIAATIYSIMTIITLCFVGSLCKAFENCQSPFEEAVIKKMKNLAFSLIPWVVLSTITEGLVAGVMTGNFDITAGIRLDMVFIILIIFVLTYIFQYGAVLQQESDETL